MTKMRKDKGITLIALVITIIVLLILAGVAISALTGDSGILKNAEKAKDKTNLANAKEQVGIAVQGARLKEIKQDTITYETLNEELGNLTNKYTITPKEDAPLWTVIVGDYKTYVTEEGYIEEPVTNPYDADGWAYAWTYNETWSDMITAGDPAEGKIVAKFYATENKITPPSYEKDQNDVVSFPEDTEYHLVIEGEGNMGALSDENRDWSWFATIFEHIYGDTTPSEPVIMPYVTEIFICDGITNIADWAFWGGLSLNKISISNSVENIAEGAFSECASLVNIKIPNSVTNIGELAFQYCRNLTTAKIPNSVTSIGEEAFTSTNLANVTIPNSVISVGDHVFGYCKNLTSVTISKGITSIGKGMFTNCENLATIVISNSVTSIGEFAFQNCINLANVTIPNGVTSIGGWAFVGCTNLSRVTIPNSVTSIGQTAFCGCTNLRSITIPNSVESIGTSAFTSCTNLKSITIPNSVTNVEGSIFANCVELNSVTIPNSVTSISSNVFYNCEKLKSITYQGTKSEWNNISKDNNWNEEASLTTIICTDGNITL